MLQVMLRDRVSETQLLDVLGRVLALAPGAIAPLEAEGDAPVRVDIQYRTSGFRTMLTVHMPAAAGATSVELARQLARQLGQDAVADDAQVCRTPYDWLLVRPDGELFAAAELPDNDDDRFLLDERPEKLRKLDDALGRPWRVVGWDTFAGEEYPVSRHPTEAEAQAAARQLVAELAGQQPAESSGGAKGIQDRVYIRGPNDVRYRVQ